MGWILRISGIVEESIVDGKGIRFAIFTQGCPHHCPGCHNPQTHDFASGKQVGIDELMEKIKKNPLLRGVTFSGGEPFCQSAPLAALAKRIHEENLDVTVFTGYTLEELKKDPSAGPLLQETDILIDGKFILEQRDLRLAFRGSRNQRVINMKRTRQEGRVILEPLEENLR